MLAATIVAIVAGVFYSLSPLTMWATLMLAGLLRWASRGLPPVERGWLLSISVLALALRYTAVGLLPVLGWSGAHSFTTYFGDDFYNIQRSLWLHHLVVGIPISSWDYFDAFQPIYGRSGYQFTLAFVHLLAGPSTYGVVLINVVFHATAVLLLYRIVRAGYGALPALIAASALWFYPTLFGWSVSALKEPSQFLLTVVGLSGALLVGRGPTWPSRVGGVALVGLAGLAIAPLRSGALVLIVAGLLAGLVLRIVTVRAWTFAAAVALVVLALATVLPPARAVQLARPQLLAAVKRHMGHVFSGGESYKLLEDDVYVRFLEAGSEEQRTNVQTLAWPDAIAFLGRASLAFVVEPGVGNLTSAKWLAVVPQQIVWYAAVLFAIPGVALGFRRDAWLTCMLCGLIAGGVAVAAPNSGNIGTLIRHRDMISPFVFVLAAAGVVAVVAEVGRWAATPRHAATRPLIEGPV